MVWGVRDLGEYLHSIVLQNCGHRTQKLHYGSHNLNYGQWTLEETMDTGVTMAITLRPPAASSLIKTVLLSYIILLDPPFTDEFTNLKDLFW